MLIEVERECWNRTLDFLNYKCGIWSHIKAGLTFVYFHLLQSSGVKGDTEQAAKRQKVDIAVDPAKASTPRSSGPCASAATPCTMGVTDMDKSTENILSHSPKSKRQSCQSAPVGIHPFVLNKYKLDNRPTAFRVISPLPSDFAHVGCSLLFLVWGYCFLAPSFVRMKFTMIHHLLYIEKEKMK